MLCQDDRYLYANIFYKLLELAINLEYFIASALRLLSISTYTSL